MANPCMFYGIPCDAGTEGNCVCRKRFFADVVYLPGEREAMTKTAERNEAECVSDSQASGGQKRAK